MCPKVQALTDVSSCLQIPLPLASSEVRQVSRRAREQWAQRDSTVVQAANDILDENFPVRPPSPTTETVYGGVTPQRIQINPLDHRTACCSCRATIVGERYQCANCPTEPQPYDLVFDHVASQAVDSSDSQFDAISVRHVSVHHTQFTTPCMSSSNSIVPCSSL